MSDGPSPAQQQLIDLATKVQEKLQSLWGQAAAAANLQAAIDKVEEMISGPRQQLQDAIDQLKATLEKIVGSSLAKTLGLSKAERAAIEEVPEDN